MSGDSDLGAMLLELERRRAERDRIEPLDVRLARIRERLVAAFGEADVAAAEALAAAEESTGKDNSR